MNEIQIYLKTSGSIAELYKDFNLYVGSYQNVLLSVYVPTSLLYQNQQGTYVNAVKTGAITTAPNGTQVTTDGYGMDYVKTVTVDNVEYAVYGQKLPNTFVTYAGTQTVVVNVVAIDNTNPDSPVILQIVTSQTAPLVVQQSAYLGQEPAIPPEEVDVINGRLSALEQSVDGLEENKLDKQTMSSGQYRAYVVTPDGNQSTIGIINGSVSSAEQLANNIARYDSFGRLATSTPTENQHATNKQYVDAADENLSNEIETLRQDIDSKSHFRGYLTTAEIQSLPNPDNGDYAWSSDTLTVWSYNGSQWVNTNNPVPDQTVPKGETTPLPDAESGSAGASTSYAAIDHVHPQSDIYASAEEFSGLNTDYQAFKTNQTTINSSVNNTLLQLASDIVTSEQETGAFINGQNTLKDVMASVEVQSKNLADLSKSPLGDDVTIVERTDNSITFRANSVATSMYQGFPLEGITEGEITVSAEWVTSGSGDPALALWWHYNRTFPNEGYISETQISGGAITAKLKKPAEDAVLYLMLYVTRNTPSVIGDTTTFTNVLVERGNIKTSWTPYLPAGTAVNITACGKNLFDSSQNKVSGSADVSIPSQNAITVTSIETGIYIGAGINILAKTLSGKTITLSGSWSVSAQNTGGLRLCWVDSEGVVLSTDLFLTTSGSSVSGILSNPPENATYLALFIYVNISGTLNAGDTVTYTNVQLEIGEIATDFEPYENQDYSSQVGQTVDVTQYDKVTNIFATTEGGAVSTKFLLSTKYELNDKVNLLVGTLANRPTTTQAYGVIYIATDQTGANRVTYLPPNTDGSVSGNWISFNS